MKLGLGTVQLGMAYGVANPPECPSRAEVAGILADAAAAGVRVLDTAPSYGESEARIGELAPPAARFRIVTKTALAPPGEAPQPVAARIEAGLRASLERLRAPAAYALLDHRPRELLGEEGEARFAALLRLRDAGLVERIGVSVQSAGEIAPLRARFPLQLVQVPLSVLDQRLLETGELAQLRAAGIEVHARSVLLQGLLTLAPAALPPRFGGLRGHLAAFRRAAAERGLSPLEAAVGFAAGLPEVDVVLCGAIDRVQLAELVRAAGASVERGWLRDFALADERVLDPSLW